MVAILALMATAPMVEAQGSDGEDGDCRGDVEIQTNPLHNRYTCRSGCEGNIIIQVGTHNDLQCDDGCRGNIIVQAGSTDSVQCVVDSFSETRSEEAMLLPGTSARGWCPDSLPEGNFYCHVLAMLLPEEICLSLDFCLPPEKVCLPRDVCIFSTG